MSVADEIEKLRALHASGALTDEEFARAKHLVLKGQSLPAPTNVLATGVDSASGWLHRLCRSSRDSWIGGVCGGLGESTPLPSWSWRALFLVMLFFFGVGVIPYIVLWICLPEAPQSGSLLSEPEA